MTVTKIDFDPDKKSIKDLFDGSLQMMIPRYQRSYSWTRDKVDEFYDDFIVESEKAEDNLSYLGTILFSKDTNDLLEVIDGQQRLVTITIFFAVVRDLCTEFIGSERAKAYASNLQKLIKIESDFGSSFINGTKVDKAKLRVGADIETVFEKLIYSPKTNTTKLSATNKAQRNVIEAYNNLYTKIRKDKIEHSKLSSNDQLEILVKLIQRVLGIEYIDIRVTDKEVAYNLFESHNAKGVALAKTDLIKNYYFGRLKGSEKERNEKMDEWDDLLDDLDKETSNMLPDRFFNYLVQSYDGTFSSSVLYRKIKPHIEDPASFSRKLDTNIGFMIDLKKASTGNKTVDRCLKGIERMKVNQCFIFLLCLERNKTSINQKSYEQLVNLVENFTYIYSAVSKQPTNVLEKVYSKHAKYLERETAELRKKKLTSDKIEKERLGGKILHRLKEDLAEMIPNVSVFLDGFKNLSYDSRPQKEIIRYTFERIEYFASKGMVSLGSLFTLDHIVPQNKSRTNTIYHSIGNLVPLSATDNSKKGDSDPIDKLDVYMENSNFFATKSVIDTLEKKRSFSIDDLEARSESLAEFCYREVFKL